MLPERESMHCYLLIGQSNMSGRGKIHRLDRTPHRRVLMLTEEMSWEYALEPLHHDRHYSGVGPGFAFGRAMADSADSGVVIGLIPCAVGETTIADWQKDSRKREKGINAFTHAVERTKRALRDGVLKGILWHQGESNDYTAGRHNYRPLLIQFIHDLRSELNCDSVPFLLGEIGETPYTRRRGGSAINVIINEIPAAVPRTAVVSSDGLSIKMFHFSTEGYRDFGKRYAHTLLNMPTLSPPAAPLCPREESQPLDTAAYRSSRELK